MMYVSDAAWSRWKLEMRSQHKVKSRTTESILSYENGVDGAPIQVVDERQGRHSTVRRMYASITNNSLASILQNAT